jgi:hypothetical protein
LAGHGVPQAIPQQMNEIAGKDCVQLRIDDTAVRWLTLTTL